MAHNRAIELRKIRVKMSLDNLSLIQLLLDRGRRQTKMELDFESQVCREALDLDHEFSL